MSKLTQSEEQDVAKPHYIILFFLKKRAGLREIVFFESIMKVKSPTFTLNDNKFSNENCSRSKNSLLVQSDPLLAN